MIKPESVALTERRLSLLEQIAEAANEIKRIDIELKPITIDVIENE